MVCQADREPGKSMFATKAGLGAARGSAFCNGALLDAIIRLLESQGYNKEIGTTESQCHASSYPAPTRLGQPASCGGLAWLSTTPSSSFHREETSVSRLLHILIIEDSPDDAFFLERELRRGGYELDLEQVDSADALERALDRQTWDIVLSDHAMPGFSALAALAILKRRGLDLPFIIVSGNMSEEV